MYRRRERRATRFEERNKKTFRLRRVYSLSSEWWTGARAVIRTHRAARSRRSFSKARARAGPAHRRDSRLYHLYGYRHAVLYSVRPLLGRRRPVRDGRAGRRRRSGGALFRVHGCHVRARVLVHGRRLRHREVRRRHRFHGRDAPRARHEVDRARGHGRRARHLRAHQRRHHLHQQCVHRDPIPRIDFARRSAKTRFVRRPSTHVLPRADAFGSGNAAERAAHVCVHRTRMRRSRHP